MFRVLDLPTEGVPAERDDDAGVAPPPRGTIRWIDLLAPEPAGLALLQDRFGFDPLAIDDCARYGLQSKLDDYGKYLFAVIHAFTPSSDPEVAIQIHEIHAFLGDSYLVTVHDNPLPAQDGVWRAAVADPAVLGRGASWALYRTVAAMLGAAEPLVAAITASLDDIELAQIAESRDVDLGEVLRLKRTITGARRVLRPLRDTLGTLHRRNDPRLSPRAVLHFRDAADHVGRLAEMVEDAREVASTIVDAHGAVQAQRTNEVMKRLAIVSAVFLPLSFIVGFFGQNFDDLPYHSTGIFALVLVTMVLIPAGLMEWFRRNWL
ncbi:MAG: magnesium transporter CorA family protein [Myxococcales bacterium]|nr:magnesium transporter CorA family protein [Myxococcales bacterium]